MAEIEPFEGILFNPKKIKNFSKVVCPPYDIISPKQQNRFYLRHPYNIIRIELGKDLPGDNRSNNKYIRAKKTFQTWLKKGVLVKDKIPAIYICVQDYLYNGKKFSRWGFICRVKLGEEGVVLFHEKTSQGPKRDRLRLHNALKANLNPIFSLFCDNTGIITYLAKLCQSRVPIVDIRFDSVRHRLWRVTNAGVIEKVKTKMKNRKIFIADGHHRYEVALAYQRFMKKRNPQHKGDENYNYVMMHLSNLEDKAITILPTHRLLKDAPHNLEESLVTYFEINTCRTLREVVDLMEGSSEEEHLFGMYLGKNRFYILRLKDDLDLEKVITHKKSLSWKRLDVSILHSLIIERLFGIRNSRFDSIFYTKDIKLAITEVDKNNFKVAFFLRPTYSHQVKEIALFGERMPHKATYFYPKLLTGLVINPL